MLMGRQFEPRVLAVKVLPIQDRQNTRRFFSVTGVDAENSRVSVRAQQGCPESSCRQIWKIFNVLCLTRDLLAQIDSWPQFRTRSYIFDSGFHPSPSVT